jgi:release factor glutamine methyltransferase
MDDSADGSVVGEVPGRVADVLRDAEVRLERAGVESAAAEARLLVAELLACSPAELGLRYARALSGEEQMRLASWLARRERREPLQHILGQAHFYGLKLRVSPEVLVPRPETERLVELGLERLAAVRRPRVLDVGTGSGALALAFKHERPDAVVTASDVSAAALEIARENAARLGLAVTFVLSDLLDAPELREALPTFDLLVVNPPYLPLADKARVSPEVQADPELALYAGEDGLAVFKRLERQANAGLKEGAYLLAELDPRNVREAAALSRAWRSCEVLCDLLGRERFLLLRK